MTKLIAEYPAYQIFAPVLKARWNDDRRLAEFKAGDIFAIAFKSRNHGTLYDFFTINSVVSCAIRDGDCPLDAVERTKKFGHQLHWANKNSVCITSQERAQEVHVAVELGDLIRFEGRVFEICAANNQNVDLIEVK